MTDATQNVNAAATTSHVEIKEAVRALVARITEREPSEISDTARFTEDLGVDSLMAIEIMVAANKLYRIHITAEEFVTLENVQMAAELVQRHVGSAPPSVA